MKNHKFTIIAAGLDPQADDFDDRFFEAGCSDATISFQKGAILLDFDRDARTFSGALMSAIADVRAAGAKVVHVEPDQIGRASGRERVCQYVYVWVVAGILKKKTR